VKVTKHFNLVPSLRIGETGQVSANGEASRDTRFKYRPSVDSSRFTSSTPCCLAEAYLKKVAYFFKIREHTFQDCT
jgi:hypothetical protein